jgi:sugar lactone lactonase YvrE
MLLACVVLSVVCVVPAAASAATSVPTWVPISPQAKPPAKDASTAAYDAATKQFVLFGGADSQLRETGDTWLWEGLSWVPAQPVTSPSPRFGASMAYDAATGQLLLFGGGARNDVFFNDTWTWNGTNWVQLHPATSPPLTDGGAMAYDPATRQIVLFGGDYVTTGPQAAIVFNTSTWVWTGSNWQRMSPATVPPARVGASMAWDPATSQLIMFGGIKPGFAADYNDTWVWTGTNWVQQHPATSPLPRDQTDLVFDPTTAQMLLIGGNLTAGNQPVGEVWAWSGTTWLRQAPAQPLPPRGGAVAGYDPLTDQLLVFGGNDEGGLPLSDTWLWSKFAIGQPSLPPGTAGLPYSGRLDAIAGTGPFAWSVVAGALPTGVSLAQTGALVGTPQAPGSFSFTVSVSDAAGHTATRAYSVTINAAPKAGVWVSDATNSVLRAFSLRASGNVAPTVTLGGSLSQLNGPDGLVLDGNGGLYVANANTGSVNYYAPGASGNVAPTRVLSGQSTGLAVPAGMTLDAAGRLYVANEAASTVTVFAAGANGNQVPVQTIGGLTTTLRQPSAVTVDAAGHIWVTDLATNTLLEFASNANGNAAPLQTIAGPNTGLSTPVGLAQDSHGRLLVSNLYGASVTEYLNQPPYGNVQPVLTLGAPAQLDHPEGLDVDAVDDLYVANEFGGVNLFASAATTPLGILTGTATGLRSPRALAVAPPMGIVTKSLPAAALGRRYRSGVFAVLGSPPLRWRVAHGHLPPGLRLTPGGKIIGIPRRLESFTFTLQVTGALRRFGAERRRLTLTIRRPPTITSVSPAHGPRRGGTPVTITGTGFATAPRGTIIRFGRLTALRIRCRTHTTCTARAPAHRPGRVEVTVTAAGLRTATRPPDRFRYTR